MSFFVSSEKTQDTNNQEPRLSLRKSIETLNKTLKSVIKNYLIMLLKFKKVLRTVTTLY